MAINFPTSPTPGEKYPSPAVAGQPIYTWDGEKWTSIASQYVPGTAPFESAMAYSGMQINGGMEVSQEFGATVTQVANLTKYIIDGWKLQSQGVQVVNGQAIGTQYPPRFTNALELWITTQNAAPAASDFCFFNHRIEGYRVAKLAFGTVNAQSVTISFWVFSTKTGLHSGALRNEANNRSYPFSYTVNAASTWEYKTITIPGDTTGTWNKSNTTGMEIVFCLLPGSTYLGTAGAWVAGNILGVTGTANLTTTAANFLITGVTVLPGTQAPTAAQSPLIMRPYDQELATCQRYWRRIGGTSNNDVYFGGYGAAGVSSNWTISVGPPMRVFPTIAFVGAWTSANINTVNLYPGQFSFGVGIIPTATGGILLSSTTTGMYITMDARL